MTPVTRLNKKKGRFTTKNVPEMCQEPCHLLFRPRTGVRILELGFSPTLYAYVIVNVGPEQSRLVSIHPSIHPPITVILLLDYASSPFMLLVTVNSKANMGFSPDVH